MSGKLLTLTPLPETFEYSGKHNPCPKCGARMSWQEDAGSNYRRTGQQPRMLTCDQCEIKCDIETGQVYQVAHEKSCSCEECHAGDFDPKEERYPSRG